MNRHFCIWILVGLGGTGSYILDLVAKTSVKEIHLYDRDDFLSHNAFRTPGAASLDELNAKSKKVSYLKAKYANMRRRIFDHPYHMDAAHIHELKGLDFVFLSLDGGSTTEEIVKALEEFGTPFMHVGMEIELVESSLRGSLRTTISTPDQRDHVRKRVSLADTGADDEYSTNIQIADLNALNACYAVIKWKKWCGFYWDFEHEHHSAFDRVKVHLLAAAYWVGGTAVVAWSS